MMPRTRNNLSASEVISGLQKHIRRGEEELAMQAAAELLYSGHKMLVGWLLNRLEVIAHEDIGIANPTAVMFTAVTAGQIRELLKAKKDDRASLYVANIILLLCRSPKSRLGDHFQAACGKPVKLGTPYEVPEYAFDKHTTRGRKLGRGLQHFRDSSALLSPQSGEHDPYEDRAYEVWARMQANAQGETADAEEQAENTLF